MSAERVIGYAVVDHRGWRYRCPEHAPDEVEGWQTILPTTVMSQGPRHELIDKTPPLCEVCGADLRPGK